VTLLESITGPRDLKALSPEELPVLASEIRDFLIEAVSRNGGHLGPNLGVVELTIALHRVFDSPADRLVFDTGHQAYVHKLLTGRQGGFARLRQRGGLSGYPNQAESEHDIVENSHASTSLSYADGLAKAYKLRGETGRTVVAVIGDGALTGGMAWEALNNIAAAKDSRLVIVVNDNGRSYQPTIGGLAAHLAAVRMTQRYEHVLEYIKTSLPRAPLLGPPLYETLHGIKKGLKDVLQPQVMFEDLGIKYLGPVGCSIAARLSCTRSRARASATTRPSRTTRTACTRCRRPRPRPPGAGGPRPAGPGRKSSGTSSRRSARGAPTSWRSPRRCCTRPGWPRSREAARTGCSTSASPSSTP